MLAALALSLALQQAAPAAPAEIVSEVRVHGNATLTDDAVIQLAGVAVGASLDAGGIEAIEKRLKDSGRFDEVQVRKRYRTLAMDEVSLVLLVHEKEGISPTGEPPSVARRIRDRLMFFPIFHYDDGYGWTYGARTSVVNIAGRGTRVSVPLSWGGVREAAVEVDRTFKAGPFNRAWVSYGISQRENPHYDVDDRRTGIAGRVERRLFGSLTLGANAERTEVTFQPAHDSIWTSGADVTFDTRRDPAYQSDAIFASATWNRLNPIGSASFASSVDRYRLDGRGFKRLFGQVVLAVRAGYDTASAPLPPYEQWMLGGATLRGLHAGELVGDTRLIGAAEVRIPFTSPLSTGRTGFNLFFDAGKVAPYGEALARQKLYRGVGGGLWLTVAIINLNLEVAHSLDDKGTRVRFATGFTF
jgi:outer membrane protein assembly factor BamA